MSGKKDKFHLRKELKFKPDLNEVSQYVGNNAKGIYYIENNFLSSKPTRYFMYLRKNGLDMNKVFDLILEQEDIKNQNNE